MLSGDALQHFRRDPAMGSFFVEGALPLSTAAAQRVGALLCMARALCNCTACQARVILSDVCNILQGSA